MIGWLPHSPLSVAGIDTPEGLADLIRRAETGQGSEPPPSDWIDAILAGLDLGEVEATLSAPPDGEGVCAPIPPRLWEHLLEQAGVSRARPERRWLPGLSARELSAQGACRGDWEEWWGWPEPGLAGAAYNQELWTWGVARGPEQAAPDLGLFSPRCAWSAVDGRWELHPALAAWARQAPRPRPQVERGPGFLAASLVNALQELPVGPGGLTPGDRAALWAAFVLPLLAVSHRRRGRPSSALELAPAFLYALPFYALHPRTQALVLSIERLCTGLLMEDTWTLRRALQALGRPVAASDDAVMRAAARRVHALAGRLLGAGAGADFDSGFGFQVARKLCREAGLDEAGRPAEVMALAWDGVVHREEGDAAGHARDLAGRLSSAFAAILATVRPGQEVSAARALLYRAVLHWCADSP